MERGSRNPLTSVSGERSDGPREAFDAFVAAVKADPTVTGLVLSGSKARTGMATARSDYDLYVITRDVDSRHRFETLHHPHLDLVPLTVEEFRSRGLPGDPYQWDRYAFVHCQVLLDRPGGLITQLVDRKAKLAADEAQQVVDDSLDAYLNSFYRSMKSHRDGRFLAARLDAAESIPHLLTLIFALYERVKPYNKYLRWELENHPLGPSHWSVDQLLPRLEDLLRTGDRHTQWSLVTEVVSAARNAGRHDVLDAWADHLNELPRR